jgi:hypothetical protein
MKVFKRFWRWLNSKGPTPSHGVNPRLYSIDVDTLAKELNIDEIAETQGKSNKPDLNATAYSGTESLIVQYIEKARHEFAHWATLRLGTLNTDLNNHNVTAVLEFAKQADREFERAADRLIADENATLEILAGTARTAQLELATFKAHNNLTREAVIASGSKRFFSLSILVLLVLIEGIVNAFFFAEGQNAGLIGGFVTAAACAGINVISSFFLGKYPIRYLFHNNAFFKILGAVSITVATAWLVTVALAIAHFRDASKIDSHDPAAIALRELLHSPFALADLLSWGLFVVSILFGVFAILDGLGTSDRYPGYEHVFSKATAATTDYEEGINSLRQELEEMKDEHLEALDKISTKVQASVIRIMTDLEQKKSAEIQLNNALQQANQALAALLNRYRDKNQIYRSDKGRPHYFDSLPTLLPLAIPDFALASSTSYADEQVSLVNIFLTDLQNIRARIQHAYTQKFDRLQPLNQHF